MMMMVGMSSKKARNNCFKVANSNPFLDGFSVSDGNLITTLPTWGPEFDLSFELYFNSLTKYWTRYAEILRFNSSLYGYCRECERILDVYEWRGKIFINIDVCGYPLENSYEVSLKNWIKIEIIQFEKLASNEKVKGFNPFLSNSDSLRSHCMIGTGDLKM